MTTNRRGMVIIAVLVIVGSSLYVATSLLFQAQADVASSHRAADVAQSRALAWSGIQALMTRLNEQRERILAGQLPKIDEEYQIYETANSLGLVRLIPIGPGGETLVPEAGKLDVNSIDAAALENTGLMTPDIAAGIIAFRSQQPGGRFQSIADLLRTPGAGITAETLYGPIQDFSTRDTTAMKGRDVAERIGDRLGDTHARGLADILTVFSCEPSLQMTGVLRINLNVPWSDTLQQRVTERFGAEAASMAKQLFDTGVKFDNEARMFQVLRQYKTPPENWPQIIDAFSSDDNQHHFGRLDINCAPYEALRGLPGVTPEQAAQMVRMRDDLSEDERRTVAWPALAQVLPQEQYDALAGKITTRCWMYRLRLAAGEVSVNEPEAELRSRVIYEVVIDLASPTPRIAYLRDITVLQSTAQMFVAAAARPADAIEEKDNAMESAETNEPADGDSPATQASRNDSERLGQDRRAPQDDRSSSKSVEQDASAPPTSASTTSADDLRRGRWRRGD